MWRTDCQGTREFIQGKESWAAAACLAQECPGFVTDVDEELVADEERSCYNCRYRRWNLTSFTCQWRISSPQPVDAVLSRCCR